MIPSICYIKIIKIYHPTRKKVISKINIFSLRYRILFYREFRNFTKNSRKIQQYEIKYKLNKIVKKREFSIY